MYTLCLNSTHKDLLILTLLFVVLICILRIVKLKKQLAFEIYRKLHPQLNFELIAYDDHNDPGLYIKNESFFILKDIKVQDVSVAITDSGFMQELTLRFDTVDFLKSKEKNKLTYRVFDKQNALPDQFAEKIIPHLLNVSFSVQVYYNSIEGRTFLASFLKKKDKFLEEEIEVVN